MYGKNYPITSRNQHPTPTLSYSIRASHINTRNMPTSIQSNAKPTLNLSFRSINITPQSHNQDPPTLSKQQMQLLTTQTEAAIRESDINQLGFVSIHSLSYLFVKLGIISSSLSR